MIPAWKGSKLTSNVQRLKVNVKRFKVDVQRFKVTHAAWGQNLSASVHFHHVAGISINYRRGENSMNVVILNRNNSTISTTLSSSCFNSNSSALQVRYQKLCPPFTRMTKEPFFPRLFSTSQKKARAYWTWQMEYCNQWPRLRRRFKFSLRKFDEYL